MDEKWQITAHHRVGVRRREIITVRGHAILCLSSSKILTPTPLSARRVCTPAFVGGGGGGHTRRAERGLGSIFWKTRDIGLPSYSNNLSTVWNDEDLEPVFQCSVAGVGGGGGVGLGQGQSYGVFWLLTGIRCPFGKSPDGQERSGQRLLNYEDTKPLMSAFL